MGNGKTVPVLDYKNKFLSFTHPAKARKLVKDGKCVVFNNDPFVIRQIKGNGRNIMSKRAFINFTEFFREEKDVWIRNVSGTNQVSLEFTSKSGKPIPFLLPKGKKPQNLSQRIPFDLIRDSMDLRNLLNRRPPVLEIMTAEEAEAYYQRRADQRGTSLDAEIEEAFTIQRDLQDKNSPTTDKAPERVTLEEKEALAEEISESINPRIIGLCLEAKKDPENLAKRLKAEDFLEELSDMEGILSNDDLEYIATHGQYKTVKKWANDRLAKVNDSEDE